MATILEKFQEAAKDVQNLTKKPTNDELLQLYALFKQATVGDCNTARPSMLNLKEKVKWDAWNGKKGMNRLDAMEQYVILVNELISKC